MLSLDLLRVPYINLMIIDSLSPVPSLVRK